jgi:hypothetical protein
MITPLVIVCATTMVMVNLLTWFALKHYVPEKPEKET